MFDRIKKAFFREAKDVRDAVPPSSQHAALGPVSEWAATQGFEFAALGSEQKFSIQGTVRGRRWRIEVGSPSRTYIHGQELRGRAELGINPDTAVLVMNRPLKELLEKKAYAVYTDGLQTVADPSLPEEMRWLAIYEEVGWDGLPPDFWTRYTVLARQRDDAVAWIEPPLAFQLLEWPSPGPDDSVPFVLMLLRGKAYLRMQYQPPTTQTLQHAATIFTSACDRAIHGLSTDISL